MEKSTLGDVLENPVDNGCKAGMIWHIEAKQRRNTMKALVESVMKYVEFPSQPWAGYEYTPKTEDKIMELAKAVGMDTEWVDPIGFACLQCEQDFSNPRVCFDCDVWELTEKEFQAILITLSSNSD